MTVGVRNRLDCTVVGLAPATLNRFKWGEKNDRLMNKELKNFTHDINLIVLIMQFVSLWATLLYKK